jgi:hypothetical protein
MQGYFKPLKYSPFFTISKGKIGATYFFRALCPVILMPMVRK